MIVYVEKLKESTTKKFLELVSNYNNPCYNCKIYNKYTKVNCFPIVNEQVEFKIKSTIPFTLAPSKQRYFGTSLTK